MTEIVFNTAIFAEFIEKYISYTTEPWARKQRYRILTVNGNELSPSLQRKLRRILNHEYLTCSLKTVDDILTAADIPLYLYEDYELACR